MAPWNLGHSGSGTDLSPVRTQTITNRLQRLETPGCIIVNQTHRNRSQWNLNQLLFCQEIQNAVCKTATIFFLVSIFFVVSISCLVSVSCLVSISFLDTSKVSGTDQRTDRWTDGRTESIPISPPTPLTEDKTRYHLLLVMYQHKIDTHIVIWKNSRMGVYEIYFKTPSYLIECKTDQYIMLYTPCDVYSLR